MNRISLNNDNYSEPDFSKHNINKVKERESKNRLSETQIIKIMDVAKNIIVDSKGIYETDLIRKIQKELPFAINKDSSIRNYLKKIEGIYTKKRGKLKIWLAGDKDKITNESEIIDYYQSLLSKIQKATSIDQFPQKPRDLNWLLGEIIALEKQENIRFHRPWVLWTGPTKHRLDGYVYDNATDNFELRKMSKTLDFEQKYIKKSYYANMYDLNLDIEYRFELDLEDSNELSIVMEFGSIQLFTEFIGYASRFLSDKIKERREYE